MNDLGPPTFYRYYEHQILTKPEFDVQLDICLLVFGPNFEDLCDPNIEPVGIYHQAGVRHYLWRDSFWSEIDWDYRYIRKRASELSRVLDEPTSCRLRHIAELVDLSIRSGAPSPTDGRPPLQDPISIIIKKVFSFSPDEFLVTRNKKKKYCRAIYRINEQL